MDVEESKEHDGVEAAISIPADGSLALTSDGSLVAEMDSTLRSLADWKRRRTGSATVAKASESELPFTSASTTSPSLDVPPIPIVTAAALPSRVQHFEALPRNELITEAALHNKKLEALQASNAASDDDAILKMHAAALAKQRMLELGLLDEDGEDDVAGASSGAGSESKKES
jgi:hypothetical protein